jgi:hypothetical protein
MGIHTLANTRNGLSYHHRHLIRSRPVHSYPLMCRAIDPSRNVGYQFLIPQLGGITKPLLYIQLCLLQSMISTATGVSRRFLSLVVVTSLFSVPFTWVQTIGLSDFLVRSSHSQIHLLKSLPLFKAFYTIRGADDETTGRRQPTTGESTIKAISQIRKYRK